MDCVDTAGRRVWLVLADPLSTKLFLDCGILDGLRTRLGPRLALVSLVSGRQAAGWVSRIGDLPVTLRNELFPAQVGVAEKVARRVDYWLEPRIGFWPLAIRFNLRHGFHLERMTPGHGNPFLDLSHLGPLPRFRWVERAMLRWHFSSRRYVPSALLRRMRAECDAIVVTNLQSQGVVPFLNAARRLGVPAVGYVASWDHAVGKGVMSPHLDRYVVQNEVMRSDLERYHGIGPDRVIVTGWPQSDLFHRHRPREEYETLLRTYGLDPSRPIVLVMGNTPTNAPYEPRFVERLVGWWQDTGARDRFSLLVRPHPRDGRRQDRFAAAIGREGAHVQEPGEGGIETLALLLRHGSCTVTNAGTILLDSLVNDRPAVCVLYDEGAPPGVSWATKNVLGEHYRELMASSAFYRAESFEEATAAVERALAHPEELAAERRRVAREVVGELDGRAGERVVDAILTALRSPL